MKKNRMNELVQKNTPIIVLLVLIIIFSILVPNFTSSRNITAILFQSAVTGFLALGQLLVIITGGIDLSQGAMVALTSIVVSVTIDDFGIGGAVAVGLLMGALIGFLCGGIIAKTSIPPFIVTLGFMGIARGLALMLANAKPVPIKNEAYKILGAGRIGIVPIAVIVLAIFAMLVFYLLRFRKFGLYMYALGSNENSARLSGINAQQIKLGAYMLSAIFCTIGGMVWCSRLVSGSPVGGYDYETESIAAVVVGGAQLSGGVGSVQGAMAGVLIFQCISSMLNLTGINPFWQGAFKGILIIVAVVISALRGGVKQNKFV